MFLAVRVGGFGGIDILSEEEEENEDKSKLD
jgi:hypothetical protein